MRSEDFAEASSYLRVLEKRMLNNDSVDRIADAQDPREALRLLSQDSEYEFSTLKRVEDYESVLATGQKQMYDLMYKLSAHREIVDIPAAKHVFHNLKVMIKSKFLGESGYDYLYSEIGNLDIDGALAYVNEATAYEDMPSYIIDAIDDAQMLYEETKNPQDIDIVLDKHMFKYMLSICEKIKNDFITEYVRLSIDFYNIKTFMRVKNMQKGSRFLNSCFVEGGITNTNFLLENYDKTPDAISSIFYYKYFGNVIKEGIDAFEKTGNYSSLERLLDNCLIDYVKKAKYIAFGAEILFAYIISKENEARQIRILVTCKNNHIKTDVLRERLRDNYA